MASTPVKVPVESEALATTSPDVVSAAAARRSAARPRASPRTIHPTPRPSTPAAAALAALSVHDKAVAAGVVAHAAAVHAEKRDSTESWTSRRRSNSGSGGAAVSAGRGLSDASAANPWSGPARSRRDPGPADPDPRRARKRPLVSRKKGDPGLDAAAEAYADYFWPWRRKKREAAFDEDIIPRNWDVVGEGDCDDGAWRARWRTLRIVTQNYHEGDAVDVRVPPPDSHFVDTAGRSWADAVGRAAKDATSLDDSRPLVAVSCVATSESDADGVDALFRGLDAGPRLPWRVSLRCVSLVGMGLGDEKSAGRDAPCAHEAAVPGPVAEPPRSPRRRSCPRGWLRLALAENRLKSCVRLEQLASLRVLDVAGNPSRRRAPSFRWCCAG